MSRATVSRSPFPRELSRAPMMVGGRAEQGDTSKLYVYILTKKLWT